MTDGYLVAVLLSLVLALSLLMFAGLALSVRSYETLITLVTRIAQLAADVHVTMRDNNAVVRSNNKVISDVREKADRVLDTVVGIAAEITDGDGDATK